MSTVEIKLLQRYRVDREAGQTAQGPEQLVIVVLKANDAPEMAYALSKIDAMVLGLKLQDAAHDAKADSH